MFPAQLSATEQAGASRSHAGLCPSVPIDTLHFTSCGVISPTRLLFCTTMKQRRPVRNRYSSTKCCRFKKLSTVAQSRSMRSATRRPRSPHELHLDVAAARGVEQEPTNEC